mgnify:FL=1
MLCAPLRADFATGAARAIGVASTDRRGARNQAPVANARAPNGAAILDPASGTLGEALGVPTSAVASFAYVAKACSPPLDTQSHRPGQASHCGSAYAELAACRTYNCVHRLLALKMGK